LDNSQPTVINTRFAFHSTPEKVEAFRRWLRKMLSQHLAGDANKKLNDWWAKYCQEGYLQGAGRAFSDAKVAAAKYDQNELRDFYSGTKEEFLRSSFGRPVAVAKVKLLAGRVYTDLKGITDTMSAKLTRTLTDGLVQGKNPREIARDIVKNVEGIDRTRARLIAQTEIIRCHAEGQLDAFQAMGVDKVGVAAEWDTAHDDRVCPECDALDDVVMSVAEARGLLPRHPGCRCGWLPANVGEDHSEQVRDKEGVEAAIDASIEAEGGKNPQDSTSWQGADADIDEERPDKLSVLDYDPDEPRDDDGPITNAQQVLQVPNVRQTDSYGCGAAAVTGIARYFDLPHTLAVVKKALGTSPKKGTSPQAIVDYLRLLGLYVEAFRGMTVSDLEHYVQRGMPVICPVQDYGGGHYLTVIGVNDGYVICQDSSQDNVVDEDEDSLQAPGRKLVALVDWDKAWHDKDASGQVYDHYGIAVSKEQA
jgi:SPP1 gp7 family putative phage head morphogenesis protein